MEHPECRCGHDIIAHQWNMNQHPEGEPEYEDLGCKECGQWDVHWGNFITSCDQYDPSK